MRGNRGGRGAGALVLFAVLGGCVSADNKASPPTVAVSSASSSAVSSTSSTLATRAAQTYDPMLRLTISSLNRMWAQWLPATYDLPYKTVSGGFFAYRSTSTSPTCGDQRLPYLMIRENAFYCPDNDSMAWDDEALFPRLSRKYGDLLLGVVLAHEWGHAIQERAYLSFDADTITLEQQADCFAGAWLAGLDPSTPIEADLISARTDQLDDTLRGFVEFRDRVGMNQYFAGSHGTAFDRIRAFQEGYEGSVSRCAEYIDDPPPVVGFEYRNLTERFRGGNAPFEQMLQTATDEFAATATGNADITIVDEAKAPPCVNAVTFGGLLGRAVSGCFDGLGSVRYRRRELQRWYDQFGDYSATTVLALGWSQLGLARMTFAPTSVIAVPVDPVFGDPIAPAVAAVSPLIEQPSSFAADCLAGRWTSELVDLNDLGQSILSPGDLDEAAQTLLKLAAERSDPRRGFDRMRAFRTGLMTGKCEEK